jgi:hypothetical protein
LLGKSWKNDSRFTKGVIYDAKKISSNLGRAKLACLGVASHFAQQEEVLLRLAVEHAILNLWPHQEMAEASGRKSCRVAFVAHQN